MEHRNAKDAMDSWNRKRRKNRIPKLLCRKRLSWKMAPKAISNRDNTSPITICTTPPLSRDSLSYAHNVYEIAVSFHICDAHNVSETAVSIHICNAFPSIRNWCCYSNWLLYCQGISHMSSNLWPLCYMKVGLSS